MAASNQTERNPFTQKAYSANYFAVRELAQTLPVSRQIPQLLSTIQQNNVVIVVGETGSGKTTQVPKAIMLADPSMVKAGGKMLALTQNRRLATQLVGDRIAEEMDVPLGSFVGLKHKDRDLITPATRLAVVTDGTLLAAAKADPSLSKYGAIVIDEAHQHTIATDLLLGLLKELAQKRKDDLKIIIMSATIDADLFMRFFPGSALETVTGREHKVLVSYLAQPPQDGDDAIIETILQIHLAQRGGNILVFASGMREIFKIIDSVQAALSGPTARFDASEIGPLECWPLSAQLSPDAQESAVESVAPAHRHGKIGRKLIVATNIAETSITLTGVTHVIDSCRVKSKIWNPRDESYALRELWVSKAVARQRAGRAGRTSEGMVWRMCTEGGFHEHLPEHSVPAIMESDMLSECLHILKMGRSPLDFPYIAAPASETIAKALGLLHQLGAVDNKGQLTPGRGEAITSMPINVYSAVVLLSSPKFGCSDEMLSVISMIEASEGGTRVFVSPSNNEEKAKTQKIRSRFRHPCGDHLTLFNIYMSWRAACEDGTADTFVSENKLQGSVLKSADRTRIQLLTTLTKRSDWKLTRKNPSKPGYYVDMMKALATGNYLRVAKRQSRSHPRLYHTVRHGVEVKLSSETDLGPPSESNEWVIYNEFHNNGSTKKTLRLVSAIAPEFLVSAEPAYWNDAEFIPEGHIKDGLVKVLANMTGKSEDYIRRGMPKPTEPISA